MGVGGGVRRRAPSDDDRPSRHRQNHACLSHSRHYEPVKRIGTAGSRIDPLPMRHIAQLWHQRHSTIRSAAPYRIHRVPGRRWRRVSAARRDHTSAPRHSVHGRGTRILGTHPANIARTLGIRVRGNIARKSAAHARKKTVSNTSADCPGRSSTASTFKSKCLPWNESIRE